jgi:tetratricopeptide (TPR) repeat protein
VAFTYNDPVIWAEYAIDVAKACRARGVKTVAVTAGYITEEARGEFFSHMDAANVDLKAFSEDFYHKVTYAHLDPVLETLTMWDRYPLTHAARIAERTLAGELATARGDRAAGIAALREAATIEDKIPYDEPPGWHAPTRHTLGAMLLEAGQPAEAEVAYREELKRNPDNGWSLYGLAQSLRAQKREAEAKDADARFAKAWQNADIKLTASRM